MPRKRLDLVDVENYSNLNFSAFGVLVNKFYSITPEHIPVRYVRSSNYEPVINIQPTFCLHKMVLFIILAVLQKELEKKKAVSFIGKAKPLDYK